MQGVGKLHVMVTLENGPVQIYAENERRSIRNEDPGSGKAGNESAEEEYEFILLKNADGSESGMLVKVLQPSVRGVAVVCEGGSSATVQQQIIETVTAVLDISSLRVSVSAMNK